ncbi:DUF4345 domain-containing protein [Aquimarina sp. 2201CG1-2-11]|uniref:DUF4345 domain-containing protein n=1 Tax=Aquimarina discodermiae TaxID=3231043 RepID=UPI0034634887
MEIINTLILSLSGLMLLFVGTMRISAPIKNYLKNSGIQLENDVNLLNEIRGVSAVMLFAGIIILLGTIVPKLTLTSFVVAILIFVGFVTSRLLSMVVDGKPNKQITQGIIFELVLGTANIVGLISTLV